MVRITGLKCRGLYSYKDTVAVDVPNRAVIVGPNNSGKSNLFRMIRLFTDTLSKPSALEDRHIAKGVDDPCLELRMELSKAETEEIVDFFSFDHNASSHEMEFVKYKNRAQLVTLLDEISVGVFWTKTAMYGIQTSVKIEFSKAGLKIYGNIRSVLHISDSSALEVAENEEVGRTTPLSNLLTELSDQASAKSKVAEFFRNRKAIVGSNLKEEYGGISEHAKRVLTGIQSYVGFPSHVAELEIKFTRLIGAILVRGVIHSPDSRHIGGPSVWTVTESLKIPDDQEDAWGLQGEKGTAKQYIAALKHVALFKSIMPAETLAGDGSNLPSFLLTLKTSPIHANRKRFENIQGAFADVFESEKLEFDVVLNHQNFTEQSLGGRERWTPTFPTPVVVVSYRSGEEFPVADAGAGVGESIYLLTLVLGSSDSVVLLDEPSINMHPGLTRTILKKIYGMAGNQILITTHSPAIVGFTAFENSARILYVRRTESSSTIRTLDGKTLKRFEKDRNRLRYMIDPGVFFAGCVILVEGESEKSLLLGIWSSSEPGTGHGMNYDDVMVAPVHGKKTFRTYRKILDAFGVPHMILADSDAKNLFEKECEVVCKDTEKLGDCRVFVIKDGKLEDLMKDIDREAYDMACAKSESKAAIAFDFAEELRRSGKDVGLFRSMLRKAVCLAKG